MYGRCWEVQDGDTLIQCSLEDICVVVCFFGNGSFVHHHGFCMMAIVFPVGNQASTELQFWR